MPAALRDDDLSKLEGASDEMRRMGFHAVAAMIARLIAEVRRLRAELASVAPGRDS